MDNAIYVGLSRQMLLQRELDITANNLANVDTTGFKFEALMIGRRPGDDADARRSRRRRSTSSPRGVAARLHAKAPLHARPARRWTSPSRARASSRSRPPTGRATPATAASARRPRQARHPGRRRRCRATAATIVLDPKKGARLDRRRRRRSARPARAVGKLGVVTLRQPRGALEGRRQPLPQQLQPHRRRRRPARSCSRACWRARTCSPSPRSPG